MIVALVTELVEYSRSRAVASATFVPYVPGACVVSAPVATTSLAAATYARLTATASATALPAAIVCSRCYVRVLYRSSRRLTNDLFDV